MAAERTIRRALIPVTGPKSRRAIIRGRNGLAGAAAAVRARLGRGSLPTFLIVGAQKAGTTFLYQEVTQHREVGGSLTKEIHFFDDNYRRGLGWYEGFFPAAPMKVVGEASPGYLFHPHAIRRIAHDLPSAKLVVLLRDPVRRAFSQYQHESRLGFEQAATFEEALALEPDRLAGELERMQADEWYVSHSHRHFSYVARGLYLEQVQRCHQLVGRERVLVLRSEDLYQRSGDVLPRVFDYLGLDPPESIQAGSNDMAAASTSRLDKRTEAGLRDFFRPHNERLYEYLGWEEVWER